MTTHAHGGWIYAGARSRRSTSRPQTPCYSQNDDVTTAISISYLEPRTPKTKQAATVQYAFLDNFHLLTSHLYSTINQNKQKNLQGTDSLDARRGKNLAATIKKKETMNFTTARLACENIMNEVDHKFNSVNLINFKTRWIVSETIWMCTETCSETCSIFSTSSKTTTFVTDLPNTPLKG